MQARENTCSMPATTYVSIGQIKALGAKLELPETSGGCETQGGEGKASCGSSGGPDDRPQEIWDKGGADENFKRGPPMLLDSQLDWVEEPWTWRPPGASSH